MGLGFVFGDIWKFDWPSVNFSHPHSVLMFGHIPKPQLWGQSFLVRSVTNTGQNNDTTCKQKKNQLMADVRQKVFHNRTIWLGQNEFISRRRDVTSASKIY